MTMEAEIGAVQLQARESQALMATTRNWKGEILLWSLKWSLALLTSQSWTFSLQNCVKINFWSASIDISML